MQELKPISVPPAVEDDRGALYDIIDGIELRSLNIVTCNPGAIRGNHYHKTQTNWIYIVEGQLSMYTQDRRNTNNEYNIVEMNPGDMIKIPSNVIHAVVIKEYAKFVEVADKAQGEDGEFYEKDTVNVSDITEEVDD